MRREQRVVFGEVAELLAEGDPVHPASPLPADDPGSPAARR
jgi:hypothetical protein